MYTYILGGMHWDESVYIMIHIYIDICTCILNVHSFGFAVAGSGLKCPALRMFSSRLFPI